MFKIIKADGVRETEFLRELRSRTAQSDAAVDSAVADIIKDVRVRGMDAVREYSVKFDKNPPREITKEELEKAYNACDPGLIKAMERAASNIYEYQSYRVPKSWTLDRGDGRVTGQVVRGLDRVGIYVPGGRAAYPSSVLMIAIPARAAGVREIIMTTPPGDYMNNAVLAAAKIAGVDRVFAVGGAQAVAAMAYGAGEIPRVDKIVGPGNIYVASAKRQVYGQVDIDMIAGPSEVLVIADGSVDARRTAADLLSQAEHDPRAAATLLCTDEEYAGKVNAEAEKMARELYRRDIIVKSVENYGACIVCRSLSEAARLADIVAPEHLEILTKEPRTLLEEIHNAGAVFLGGNSPEPLGDYMAGPSHVLPTSGSARFFSPLGADSFIKRMSVIEYTPAALEGEANDIITIARAEELSAHANSIEVRM